MYFNRDLSKLSAYGSWKIKFGEMNSQGKVFVLGIKKDFSRRGEVYRKKKKEKG